MSHAAIAALPFAAALTLLLAGWLPVEFEYRPNDLGIVSLVTRLEYPKQQEIFWTGFGVVVGTFLTWVGARCLRRVDASPRPGLAVELLGVTALGSALWLPGITAALCVAGCLIASVFIAMRAPAAAPDADDDPEPEAPRHPPPWRSLVLGFLGLALASVYASHPVSPDGFWGGLANLANQIPDFALAADNPLFHVEWGEHLAWADQLRAGLLPGRDFFCLYGPLYDYSLVGAWQMFGRSIASFTLWQGITYLIGFLCFLIAGLSVVRSPVSLLALPLLIPYVHLRIGLPLLALATLATWRRRGEFTWCAISGGLAGTSLVYSQEFGAAATIVGLLAVLITAERRAILGFVAGLVVVPSLVALHFAAQGGLGPMLSDLIAYPGYVAAGYANQPLPSLLRQLPLDLRLAPTTVEWKVTLQLAYGLPAIAIGSLLLCLPLSDLNPLQPGRWLPRVRTHLLASHVRFSTATVALFGLLAYRAALGRSDLSHLIDVMAPAALLLCAGIDRALSSLRGQGWERGTGVWRAAVLAFVIAQTGLYGVTRTHADPGHALMGFSRLTGSSPPGRTVDERIRWLTTWIRDNSAPDDSIFLLPNLASYFYLTERRSPTRFVVPAMIVTDAHRREVLESLQHDPPRFVVWDEHGIRIDHLTDEQVLGADTLAWIADRYEPVARHDDFIIHAQKPPGP